MRHYELVVILSPMLNQDQAAETWDRIKGFISSRSGGITHEERWGTRRLAYPIRKGSYQFLEGSYHLTRFNTERPFNRELETFLRQDEQVLRSLVVAAQPPAPAPIPAATAEPASAQAAPPEAEVASEVEEPAAAAEAAPPEAEAPAPSEEPAAQATDDAPASGAMETPEPEKAQP